MDWTTCILLATLPALAAGAAWLARRATADGRRREPTRATAPEPWPAPRTPYELVAAALVDLDVEHVTLFAGDAPGRLHPLARGHLDVRADVERPEVHEEAAAAALEAGRTVEFGGAPPAPLVAAAPVVRGGRPVGALAVSSWRAQRGRLTFAHRRALRELADAAAALPPVQYRVRGFGRRR